MSKSTTCTLQETLQWFEEIGITDPLCTAPQNAYNVPELSPTPTAPVAKPATPKSSAPTSSPNLEAIKTREELHAYLSQFEGCSLKQTATHMVFSDGLPSADIMVIGEAPGAEEDRQGKPFVGMSGQLLDKALAAIGLSRTKNVYISNIIPWRPPGNRQPSTEEIALCLPFIKKHVELINPKIILCAGGVAVKSLLNTNLGITRLRGTWHPYETQAGEIPLLATYHPAFLLRSPSRKKDVWHDLLTLRAKALELGIAL